VSDFGRPQTEIRLRHLGGEERMVSVVDATEDGCLYVRWPGAGTYAVRLFRAFGELGAGWVYLSASGKFPTSWKVADLESARQAWRVWTKRQEPKERA
jgi:hypothetical protein